jgi:phosphoribosyl 1,2-cyclic phosphodiesterase
MHVRFWGTRGSIASPGPQTVRYGGNTSCVEVGTHGGALIILDAGTGLRALGAELMKGPPRHGHLLIGHTHWDHIQGFPFFAPLHNEEWEWDVYAPRGFDVSLRETLAGQMQYRYFPVSLENLGARVRFHDLLEGTFDAQGVRVTAHYLNHPALTLGYRLEADGASVVYATDHEPRSDRAAMPSDGDSAIESSEIGHHDFVGGADLLIHDAQYLASEYPAKRGWGHSTIEYVVDVAQRARVRRLCLFHHDPCRSDDAVDALVESARERVRARGASLDIFAAQEGATVEVRGDGSQASTTLSAMLPDTPPPLATGPQHVVVCCGDAAIVNRLLTVVGRQNAEITHLHLPRDGAAISGDANTVAVLHTSIASAAADCAALRLATGNRALPILMVGRGDPPRTLPETTDWIDLVHTDQYLMTRLRAMQMGTLSRWAAAPTPPDEKERLDALYALGLLDTEAEERFDRITRIAARTFDVSVALVTLVDAERQWFKSRCGTEGRETPRDRAFCAHAILEDTPLVVPDALLDDRFADNPAVTGPDRVRFYAGHPLRAHGRRVGTLCLADHRPRLMSANDANVLRDLASLVEHELIARAS